MLEERMLHNSWFNRTVQDLFVETCQKRQEKAAIVYKDESITFNELKENADKVSSILINLGVEPGDKVAVLPTTTPEFVYTYFGILQVGAVMNPLNLLWGNDELKSILLRNDPTVIITVDEHKGKNYIDMIRKTIPDLHYCSNGCVSSEGVKSLSNIISVSNRGKKHDGFMDLRDLMDQTKDRSSKIARRMQTQECTDIQFICQTSGSTGLSKSALWDHRAPLASAHFGIKSLMINEKDTFINFGPFFHNSGLYALNTNLVYAGTTLYLLESFNPEEAIQYIDKYKITTTFGFDAHWQALKNVEDLSKYDFTIRKVALAGAPKTYDMVQEMCNQSDNIAMLYAQAENGPLVSLGESGCMVPEINKFTNGRPLPGVEVIIKNLQTGDIVTGDQNGEICYKSPYMFKGYFKQPDETANVFDENGYFHSGDFGAFSGGYIQYLGRLGGVIKSGGENVSIIRVASQLVNLFPNEIEDAQVIGLDDEYWGKKVVSWVKIIPNLEEFSAIGLRKRCKGQMADYEIPKEILVWKGQWPTTAEGKIDFKRLTVEAEKQLVVK